MGPSAFPMRDGEGPLSYLLRGGGFIMWPFCLEEQSWFLFFSFEMTYTYISYLANRITQELHYCVN